MLCDELSVSLMNELFGLCISVVISPVHIHLRHSSTICEALHSASIGYVAAMTPLAHPNVVMHAAYPISIYGLQFSTSADNFKENFFRQFWQFLRFICQSGCDYFSGTCF